MTYTKEMKAAVLGVSEKLLKDKGAVCAEVAEAMAVGAFLRSPADLAVAITGVAGPEPDEDGNPVGLVYCAVVKQAGKPLSVRKMFRGRSREDILKASVEEGLKLIRKLCLH